MFGEMIFHAPLFQGKKAHFSCVSCVFFFLFFSSANKESHESHTGPHSCQLIQIYTAQEINLCSSSFKPGVQLKAQNCTLTIRLWYFWKTLGTEKPPLDKLSVSQMIIKICDSSSFSDWSITCWSTDTEMSLISTSPICLSHFAFPYTGAALTQPFVLLIRCEFS